MGAAGADQEPERHRQQGDSHDQVEGLDRDGRDHDGAEHRPGNRGQGEDDA